MVDDVVLLTGASGAIGAEAARGLAARGARLALVARREEMLDRVAADIRRAGGAVPFVVPADLGTPGEADRAADAVLDHFGRVDVLVNGAGATVHGLSWVVGDDERARRMFQVNFWSPKALLAAVVPGMVDRGRGLVVDVGSMARVSPFPHLGHYAASRAAVSAATQVLQLEVRPRGVRVVELALGPVDSPASRETRRLHGSDTWLDGPPGLSTPERAAAALVDVVVGTAEGVVHHPGSLRWIERFPFLGRRYSRRVARGADLDDRSVHPERTDGQGGAGPM
ncbi:short-chain dehydrogenase [Blastococcus sp. TF02-8]|uniref:SDR family NAD(P)-dependent oxidoreductase n=1 Tax=Blastococcus sp. TF02-8 TaxID=2250574 RepID=UPI000DE9D73C|nr:SDR family NAD(P)-dependent oxidoreductase [Blastococcus sp. TF02-8]RBY96085.1 short-chain dehydrogenase [Blastococcus sp. TF02-8]